MISTGRSKSKHRRSTGDVIPRLFGTVLVDEQVPKFGPHPNDPISHTFDLSQPVSAFELLELRNEDRKRPTTAGTTFHPT